MTYNEKFEPFGSRDLEPKDRSVPPNSARSSEKERVKVTMPLTAVIACALVVAAVITAIAFAITGIKNAEIKLAAVKPTLTPFIIETESPTTDPWVPDRINPDAPSGSISYSDGVAPNGKDLSLIERSMSSVVSIDVMTQSGYSSIAKSSGSGVIVSPDGYIVTCNHIIDGASKIYVYLDDGSSSEAVLIGHDSINDLAVIKIDAEALPFAIFGNSDTLRIGENVYAIGNALGQLSNTYTRGVISALDRTLKLGSMELPLLQTDTAINRGNSGGGLFRASDGLLIGIVNASKNENIDLLGFAVPSSVVVNIIGDLMDYGFVTGRPYFGANTETVALSGYGFFTDFHTYPKVIELFEGSPAEKAGILEGDVILSVNGSSVSDSSSLERIIYSQKSGDTVELTVMRDSENIVISVVLDERIAPEN